MLLEGIFENLKIQAAVKLPEEGLSLLIRFGYYNCIFIAQFFYIAAL